MPRFSMKMFHKQTIAQASILMTVAALAGRIMGFFREVVVAHTFGATAAYDLYLIAILFPTVITTILMYALPGAIIPIYLKEKMERGPSAAWRFILNCVHSLGFVLLLATVALIIAAPAIIRLYSPALNAGQIEEAVRVLRSVSLVVLFGGLFAILRGALNADKHFLIPALGPILLNLMVILSALILSKTMATMALGIGLASGYALQFLSLTFIFFRKDTRYKPVLHVQDSVLRGMFGLLFFVLLVEAIGRVNVLVDRAFMARLPEGGLSALSYADYLCQFPIGVIGFAVGAAIFPAISEQSARQDWDGLIRLFSKGIRSVLIFTIPVSLAYVVFAPEVIRVIYQRGAFDARATAMTSGALQALSAGLVAYVCLAVVMRVYYAFQEKRILLYSVCAAFGVKLIFSILFVPSWREVGLALATSLSGVVNLIILLIFLKRRLGRLDGRQIFQTLLKVSVLSILSVGSAKGVLLLLSEYSFWAGFLCASAVGLVIFLTGMQWLGLADLRQFGRKILGSV